MPVLVIAGLEADCGRSPEVIADTVRHALLKRFSTVFLTGTASGFQHVRRSFGFPKQSAVVVPASADDYEQPFTFHPLESGVPFKARENATCSASRSA
jgi:hypothetical protein